MRQWPNDRLFCRQGFKTIGIDISAAAIQSNKQRFAQAEFQVVQADRPTPFPDGSFDAIYCSEVVEHVYDAHYIFGEFGRLLRPNGLLIVTTPYHALVKNIIVAASSFDRHFNPTWQHIRFWTKSSLTRVAKAHGLTPVQWGHVGRFWPMPKSFFVTFRTVGPAAGGKA